MNQETALAKLTAKPHAANLAAPVVAGRWVNQFGSIADFTVNGTALGGTYTSNVGGATVTGQISGHTTSDIVAFSVLWQAAPGNRASMTSWVGQIVNVGGTEVLKTLWHLIIDVSDAAEPASYNSILAGADEFSRASANP